MSAADRMVVRTRDGAYRSVPRRTGLGMISRGQAEAATTPAPPVAADVDPLGPHGDEYQEQGAPADLYPPELFEGTAVFVPDIPDEPLEGQIDLSPDREADADLFFAPVSGEPDDAVPTVDAVEFPEPPRGNASRQEWADYAQDQLGIKVTSAMSRTTIREAVQEQLQSVARLPQPALTGGRLETPEDEPAAERLADDEDPGTE